MKLATAFLVTMIAYACTSNNAEASCNWNNPGADRYTGDQAEALNNYKDIPANIRQILKNKINAHQYDDQIEISRIGMVGKYNYNNGRDMHWGQNKMCKGEFNISKWNYMHTEAALVYTYNGYSIAIPSVCGNVFRLDILAGGNKSTGGGGVPETETFIPQVMPTPPEEEVSIPEGGGNSSTSTVPSVNWPSDKPIQNSIVPQREREFMPVPPMPVTPGYVPQVPAPIVNIPVVPAVPEPSTYAMMFAGILVVGFKKYTSKK